MSGREIGNRVWRAMKVVGAKAFSREMARAVVLGVTQLLVEAYAAAFPRRSARYLGSFAEAGFRVPDRGDGLRSVLVIVLAVALAVGTTMGGSVADVADRVGSMPDALGQFLVGSQKRSARGAASIGSVIAGQELGAAGGVAEEAEADDVGR